MYLPIESVTKDNLPSMTKQDYLATCSEPKTLTIPNIAGKQTKSKSMWKSTLGV